MAPLNQYHPQTVPHPGMDLGEKLQEMNMGPKEFGLRTGKPEKTIIAVIKGESSITPDMAVQFENALGIPARYWIQRQRDHDESLARERHKATITESIGWARSFPLGAMMKLGWLPQASSIEQKTKNLLAFFGFSSSKAWEAYYLEQALKTEFRISLAQTKEPHAISAWLWMGERQAQEQNAATYSEGGFKAALVDVKRLMAKHPADFFPRLQKICAEVGVKVVHTPCLPKTPICGSTRWVDDTPLIQLTGRYKRNDSFWFTFFHEAGHILLHGKKDVFLEKVEWSDLNAEKEQEANDFAVKWTFTQEEEQEVIEAAPLDLDDIRKFARKFGTHPALIIGRLQHKGLIPFSLGRELIQPVDLES